MIYADQRWVGNHGIGRFARHMLAGLEYQSIPLTSHPAAPLDSWRLAQALRKTTSNDLFFSPGYNTPLFSSSKLVFTIHDLSHVFCPENSSLLIRLYYATVLKKACQVATRILTVSDFTRTQIAKWSGVAMNKIFNVGCGVDSRYHPGGDTYGIPFPYLLCVSNRKPHKNEFRMVEAFAKASVDPNIHLVFTGPSDPAIGRWIRQLGISSRVDFLGTVPEQKLPSLYRGARGLLFASLYEGFGLPILEAMACGTPVLTSKTTAMPEVAGNAALLVDPVRTSELAEAIEQLVHDSTIRIRLQEKGFDNAARFSWDHTQRQVHELLHSL
jgi:glycosyltransferase involved in cell wall biosynthesis